MQKYICIYICYAATLSRSDVQFINGVAPLISGAEATLTTTAGATTTGLIATGVLSVIVSTVIAAALLLYLRMHDRCVHVAT